MRLNASFKFFGVGVILRFKLKQKIFCGLLAFLADVALLANTTLSDDTVLATLPMVNVQGLSTEEALFSAQKKVGLVDPDLAINLSSKHVRLGILTDNVRYFGSALAILESVGLDHRTSLKYHAALADTQSLLHQFDDARKNLGIILAAAPEDFSSRQKLFYLELLRGSINAASKHCNQRDGFVAKSERELCALQVSLTRGGVLTDSAEKSLLRLATSDNPQIKAWAFDLLLDHKYLQCAGAKASNKCDPFRKFVFEYVRFNSSDNTRVSYAADRLLMANFPEDVLILIPVSTKNFAVATRRMVARAQLKETISQSESESESELELKRLVLSSLQAESDRGKIDHDREAALIALFVDKNPSKAQEFALQNWGHQREFIDSWLMQQTSKTTPSEPLSRLKQWSIEENVKLPRIR